MMKFITPIAFVILALNPLAHAQSKLEFPAGWNPATASDYSAEDLSFRKQQVPNHIEADFNSDGIADHAWILINTSKGLYGLFVLLGQKSGGHKIIAIDEHKRETEKLFMGISLWEPGQYKTACGKGYWECKDNETAILNLETPGINFFAFESANSVFYWNSSKKEFKRIWMSD